MIPKTKITEVNLLKEISEFCSEINIKHDKIRLTEIFYIDVHAVFYVIEIVRIIGSN